MDLNKSIGESLVTLNHLDAESNFVAKAKSMVASVKSAFTLPTLAVASVAA